MGTQTSKTSASKIIGRVILALVVLVAGFSGVVMMQPDEFSISRSLQMSAQPAAIFPYINNHHKFNEWSPWAKMDPNATVTYEGPEAGKDAAFHWASSITGEGNSTIAESVENERVKYDLAFIKPFEGKSVAEITLAPADGGTLVTWSMSGKNNFIGKAMGFLMNCQKMMTEQFDAGLADLKALVDAKPE